MDQKFEILFGSLFFYGLWLSSFKMFLMRWYALDKYNQVTARKVKARWVSSLKVADNILEKFSQFIPR